MKHFIIGTAGHVDHGKTSLIKALTQIDCDTHKEEMKRGITINLGFAHIILPSGLSCGIVDMPGHKDFINTMISGACGIDMVLFTIAADSGIMPQTIEHLNIINALGIQNGIIVITKTDLVDEEFIELVNLEIIEMVEGTCLENAPVISVSSHTGEGMQDLIDEITKISDQIEERSSTTVFRMYPDRIFEVKGSGYILTGSVLSGEANVGDDIFLLPGREKKYKLRGIQRFGVAENKVIAGDRAALSLNGLKQEDFERGMMLSNAQLDENKMIDAQISVFNDNFEMGRWSEVLLLTGSFQCRARIHLLSTDLLKSGESALVQIHLEKESVIQVKDKFIIRNTSNDITIGGGIVFDNSPLHHRKRNEKLLSQISNLADAVINDSGLISLVIIELDKIRKPLFVSRLSDIMKIPVNEIVESINDETDQKIVSYARGEEILLILKEHDNKYYQSVMELLEGHHSKYPILDEGLNVNEFQTKLDMGDLPEGKIYLELLFDKMNSDGKIRKVADSWILSHHEAKPDKKNLEEITWLENLIESFGMQKPILADIEEEARSHRIKKDKLTMMMKYLQNRNKVYIYEKDVLHASLVDRCRKLLLDELKNRPYGINEGDFKKLIDGTKKIIHPLLGIFKKEGIVEQEVYIIKITDKGRNYSDD